MNRCAGKVIIPELYLKEIFFNIMNETQSRLNNTTILNWPEVF